MSVQANHQASDWRKTPRITIVPPIRRDRAAELGPITERFFVEGDEQAASGYKNLGIDHPGSIGDYDTRRDAVAVRDRDLEFDSFDQVPKRHRPLVGFALVISGVAVMVAAWTVHTTGVPWRWNLYGNVAAPSIAAKPASATAPAQQSPVVEPIRAVPQAPQPAPPVAKQAAPLAARAVPRADPRADPDDPDTAKPADPADPDPDVRASHRSRPMRGYVWSPAARAMVPTESSASAISASAISTGMAEPTPARTASTPQFSATGTTAPRSNAATVSAPAVAPTPSLGAFPTGPAIAPANTGPPPFEPARVPVPVERAPIIE